jgi:gamma-glutamyltranspeptidase/glutathione hydrolase
MRFFAHVSVAATLVALLVPSAVAKQPQTVEAKNGVVVSVSEPGSKVGVAILKQGGNAVDAAVATALAMSVTYPPAGNIGGGGFMMIHPADGRPPVCIDYREVAPAAATRHMFSLTDSRHSRKIVGVPGTVRGLKLAHQNYGKLPWKQLVTPAVTLARDGFPVDAPLAKSLNAVLGDKKTLPFTEFRRVFASPDGKAWHAGDRLVQPDLARTLEQIAAHGADGFYTGSVAKLIAAEMKRGAGNGLITTKDLAAYRAKIRKPIHTTFRGHDVYGPPPPSSGGITLVLMLNVIERFNLREKGRWSAETNHLLIETMRRAYLDRARHLGDADFVKIPAFLTTKKYATKLAKSIDRDKATASEQLAPDIPLAAEGTSTTHFSIVDAAGMAVANTYTLENSYGSRVVVRGGGFLLNNEMGDFNWKPGHTDRRGRIGTEANTIQPGKRMLSSQCPTLVAKNGRIVLVTGSPGGRTIINTALSVVLNVLEFKMPLPQAIAAPRLHHQWLPDVVRFEEATDVRHAELVKQLTRMGHTLNDAAYTQGDAHSIYVTGDGSRYIGVADFRRSGFAAEY